MTYFYDDGARYVNVVSFKDNNEKKKEKKRKAHPRLFSKLQTIRVL